MKNDRLSLGLAITAVIALGLAVCFPFFRFSYVAPETGAFTWAVLSLIPTVWLLSRHQVERSSVYATLIFTVFAIFLSGQTWLANHRDGYVFFQLDNYLRIELAVLSAFISALLSVRLVSRPTLPTSSTGATATVSTVSSRLPKTALLGALLIMVLTLGTMAFSSLMFFTLNSWIVLLALAIYAVIAFLSGATSQIGKKRLYAGGILTLLLFPLYYYLQHQVGNLFSPILGSLSIPPEMTLSPHLCESTMLIIGYLSYLLLAPLLATGLSALLAIGSAKYHR
ncbi:hypothetical protein [Boudabousia marimammalium]|uniref:Uncharacterized protein n=1 Tax=Boudabousia marimammalium TaxID=156892 RepID=A0A1Q5PRT0_9ACTO|nr:hypothetical protein [Boudabousia marimammalium]OKL50281.1 hypothetical protein BM477_02515 [Boudabousia marimammalium]